MVRWFCCLQHGATDPPSTSAGEGPVLHGDAVPQDCIDVLPVYDGYEYAWHKEATWLRCAMNKASLCQGAPTYTRSETHLTPCAACKGQDTCFAERDPAMSYDAGGHEDLAGEDSDRLDDAVDGYFEEIVELTNWWLDAARGSDDLEIGHHAELFGSLCCTEDADHVVRDSEEWVIHPECHDSCRCTKHAYTSNLSRALRFQDANATRMRTPSLWFTYSAAIDIEETLRLRGALPNQQWMCREPTINATEGKITEYRRQLEDKFPRWADSEDLDGRVWLAKAVAAYANLDPGLSPVFRERLSARIVTILSPVDDFVSDLVDNFECLALDKTNKTKMRQAVARRDNLIRAMLANRTTIDTHTQAQEDKTDGFITSLPVTPRAGLDDDCTCGVCQEDFDLSSQHVPPYVAPRTMPCCQKPLHHGCLRAALRTKQACPLCRHNFTELHGAKMKLRALPIGLVDSVNTFYEERAQEEARGGRDGC